MSPDDMIEAGARAIYRAFVQWIRPDDRDEEYWLRRWEALSAPQRATYRLEAEACLRAVGALK